MRGSSSRPPTARTPRAVAAAAGSRSSRRHTLDLVVLAVEWGSRAPPGHAVEHPPRGPRPRHRRLRHDRQDLQGHDRRDAALADRAVHRARGRAAPRGGWSRCGPSRSSRSPSTGCSTRAATPVGSPCGSPGCFATATTRAPTRPTRSPRCRRWHPGPRWSRTGLLAHPLTAAGAGGRLDRGRVRARAAVRRRAVLPGRSRGQLPWPSRSPGSSPPPRPTWCARPSRPAWQSSTRTTCSSCTRGCAGPGRSTSSSTGRPVQPGSGSRAARGHARPGNVGERRQGRGVRAGPGPGQRPRRRGRPRRGGGAQGRAARGAAAAPRLDGPGSQPASAAAPRRPPRAPVDARPRPPVASSATRRRAPRVLPDRRRRTPAEAGLGSSPPGTTARGTRSWRRR